MANGGLLGLLSPEEQAYARNQGLLGLGAGLLSGSGYSPRPVTLGEAAGRGVTNMQQFQQQAMQRALQNRMLQARLGGATPSAVNEFLFWQGLPREQQEQFLQLKRAPTFLDVGSQFVSPSAVTPTQPRPVVEKDLPPEQLPETKAAQVAAVEEEKTKAKKRTAMPKARNSIRTFKLKADIVRSKVDEALALIGPTTAGAGSLLSVLPASKLGNYAAS